MISYCNLFAATYYYERILDPSTKDGHYITIGNNSCYDSDKDGFSSQNGLLKFICEENEKLKYRGNGYFGNSIYWFSKDYSQLEIYVVNLSEKYTYKRLTGPTDKDLTLRKSKLPKVNNDVPANDLIVIDQPIATPIVPNNDKPLFTVRKVWENCTACHGTGCCYWCHGSGYDLHSKTGHCHTCYGSGICPICKGERGHYKEVYE